MLNIDENFAKDLLEDAALVLSAENDDCREPDNASNSIGRGEFQLYRIGNGQHIMKAHLVDEGFTQYNLLQTPAEVIQAFLSIDKGNELSSYLKTLYRCEEEEEVTFALPKKLLKNMKLQARTRKQDLQSYILSQLNDSCLNMR
ncbi:hypothetical protein [Succinivibrio dextrinosolvens]|uniref:hypothetical protein n=1 Tax=Succinivibrio dextrinosolvens TaxID=83771 RepID=UPI00241F4431|nr:hypothetical protein [Succinivibrio dextrinosolvens]MBE6422856.1 hypothetical protein [Succinivibrio dextrinosolvens]